MIKNLANLDTLLVVSLTVSDAETSTGFKPMAETTGKKPIPRLR